MAALPPPQASAAEQLPGWVHPSSAGRARRHRQVLVEILKDGALAGALAAVLIAGFLAAASLLAGNSPWHVAGVLGDALFGGPEPVAGAFVPALAYTGVHAAALIVIGIMIAGLARVAAAALQGWYIGFLGVLFVVAHVIALPIWFNDAVRPGLSLGSVIAATGLGTMAMCVFLWRRTPGIGAAMHEPD